MAKEDIRTKCRGQGGMSLATVLGLGIVLTIMVTALLTTIMSVFQSITKMNTDIKVRGTSEAGVDYAVAMLNSGAAGWDFSQTKGANVSPGAAPVVQTIPSSIHGNPNATVVSRVFSPGNPGANSMLFDPMLNANFPNSFRMLQVDTTQNGVTKSVRTLLQPIVGSAAGSQHGYALFGVASVIYAGQAALNSYNTPANESYLVQTGADGGTLGKISQIWSSAGGMTRSIAQGGAHYEFPNPLSYYNQQFNIAGQTYKANPANSAPWMQLYGNVWSNGAQTAYYPLLGPSDPGGTAAFSSSLTGSSQSRPSGKAANVFGISNGVDANGVYNPLASSKSAGNAVISPTANPNGNMTQQQLWKGGSVGFNENGGQGYSYPQPAMPGGESAPNSAIDLGALNLKNGSQLIIDNTVAAPTAQLNTVGSKSAATVRIPPGNYKMSSLTLSSSSGGTGASISITPSTQAAIASGASPEVNFYLEGTTTPSVAMSVDNNSSINTSGISGTGINFQGKTGYSNTNLASNQIALNNTASISETSGSASQLHIHSTYGNGTDIILQGNERAIIDAPLCDVTVGSILSNGSPVQINNNANFYGAIYAGNIAVQSGYSGGGGAFVHYDYNLHPPGRNNPWNPWSPIIGGQQIIGYRSVSWQERVGSGDWVYGYQ